MTYYDITSCNAFATITASTTYVFLEKIYRSRVLIIIYFNVFTAQCTVYEVAASPISSNVERISWKFSDCNQTSEFTVMYRLNIKDQCNAPDELLGQQQSIDCVTCNRTLLDSGVYSYYLDLSGLHPFSTYAYSVQPKTPDFNGSALSWDHFTQFTTDTAGECLAANVITTQNLINASEATLIRFMTYLYRLLKKNCYSLF